MILGIVRLLFLWEMQSIQEAILVLGSAGQVGTDLVQVLRESSDNIKVIASDICKPKKDMLDSGPFEEIDVLDKNKLFKVIKQYNVKQVYQLVAMLSAKAEKMPMKAWELNMQSLFNVLELARKGYIQKVYWPSSIASFGHVVPKQNTPQFTVMNPTTVYGISKLSGELWCNHYHKKYKVDVRSIRYPGLISYKTEPGGGTTDYAVDIFHKAKQKGKYTCYLAEDTALPMMYMPDAIKATIGIMEAPAERIKIRASYNVAAFSFDPATLSKEIQKYIPDFTVSYDVDYRNEIAQDWPQSIDDTESRQHWGWQNDFTLAQMVKDMLKHL